MKKLMMFAAIAAAALSSCSNSELIEQSDAKSIGFETYVGKASSRGVPVAGVAFADGATMSVWGYYTTALMGTNLTGATAIPNLAGATVTKTGADTWGYSPLAYWKSDSWHNFFAVAPAETAGVAYSAGEVTYTVQDAIDDQVDFMVADPLKATTKWDGTTAVAKQVFTFHHILSQIKYSAKITADVADLNKVKEIKVKSVKIESMSATDEAVAGTLATTGKVSIIAKADANAYAYEGTPTGTIGAYTLTPTTPVDLAAAATTPEYVEVKHKTDDVLMLMPQTTVGKLRFTIALTYKNEADVAQTAEAIFLTSNVQTWDVNKIYHYKFDINMPQVLDQKPIEFGDPTITEWDTTENEVNPVQ